MGGLYFGVADHPDYHRPTDDVEAIDPAFFGAAVTTLIDAFRTVDALLDGTRPDGESWRVRLADDANAPCVLLRDSAMSVSSKHGGLSGLEK